MSRPAPRSNGGQQQPRGQQRPRPMPPMPPMPGMGNLWQGGQYGGYGFQPPGPACPPTPEEGLKQCIQALQSMLEESLQRTDLPPWIHPPWRARSLCERERVILSTTAGLNPALNAAGIALQVANTVPGSPAYAPQLLEMDAVNDNQVLLEIENPINIMTRISSWGVTVNNVPEEGVIFTVVTGSVAGGPPSPPDPVLSTVNVEGHQSVFLLLQGNQRMQIRARLRDTTNAPAMIDIGVCGWSWPVRNRTDDPKGAFTKTGYGVDCR